MTIPIIDLFAGPGGLGEGFSQVGWKEGNPFFRIGLSVEKEPAAHRTLKLRSFVRQFKYDEIPAEYFSFLKEGKNPEELFLMEKFAVESAKADEEAWNETLRKDKRFNKELDSRINRALKDQKEWVLIGGPPCQAYSNMGRVRNMGIEGYVPEKDKRYFLYQHYLRIIAVHMPAVFVMENVKGLLSSKINGGAVFEQIMSDLKQPSKNSKCRYRIFSLVKESESFDDPVFAGKDFVIKSEKYGIPQARHRVILFGVREDVCSKGIKPGILSEEGEVSICEILDLPELRSGLSNFKGHDKNDWCHAIGKFPLNDLKEEISRLSDKKVFDLLKKTLEKFAAPVTDLGGNFVNGKAGKIRDDNLAAWFEDERIQGVFNHSARGHMVADLHRYLYASCFSKVKKRSPEIIDFPETLKPNHKNRDSGDFKDRFRVQLDTKPATTIASHISKDGHYYIHPDQCQCRSLTVREAARIQTFPDNYFFCGGRTQQYVQVGNAVPPLLAYKIAVIVKRLLLEAGIG